MLDVHANSLSYVHGACDVPLIGLTIGDMLDGVAEAMPERKALVSCHQQLRYSYAQLREECNRFARALMALGIAKGDRVGVWAPNCAEWMIAQYATAKIGAILVNINPAYRASELEYALVQSGCGTLIIAPPFRSQDYAAILREVPSERLPQLKNIIAIPPQEPPGALEWNAVMSMGERVSPEALAQCQAQQFADDPINIQYTSGTTGFPKGATLSHHAILNNGFFCGERMRFTERDRICVPVPFYHCFGMVIGNLAALTHGAAVVLPAPAFDPRKTIEAVQNEKCTALYGVPTMFIAELALPDLDSFDLSSLRTGCMAGAPCPIEVMRQVMTRLHMPEVTIAYGMTETAPVSFQSMTTDAIEKRVSTVGCAHPHVECKIINPDTGATLPRGTAGELLSRGYLLMLGYWDNPTATAGAIDSARWMHTGDLAVMDADGYPSIVGRLKDMIIRGGENIYPREIEEFLYTHPAVRDVQVIGVPDEKYGEEVMAWVVLKPEARATADELREYCRNKIAHYKVPRHWRFVDSFPMTVSGKVQKYKMREAALSGLIAE